MRHIVILGAGTAGTITANRLARALFGEITTGRTRITVVDHDPDHVYQPGLLFIPFGVLEAEHVTRDRRAQLSAHVDYMQSAVERIDPEHDTVRLENGGELSYDACIIATGSRTVPDETPGLLGDGWQKTMFEFYSLEGARRLGEALRDFTGGKLLINVARMPIKSPVAPLEFAFLADWYFTKRGIRDKVTITYATPLAGAYSSPDSARALARLLEEKGIGLETGFATEQVLGAVGALVADGGRRLLFDLLVEIPAHRGAAFIGRSPALGDAMDFVRTDPHTLQAHRKPNLFAIGDATDVPTPKTGSVAHFESEVLTQNVLHFLAGEPLEPGFDGHGSSFVETGFEKAMMIDFNYDTEQRAGRIPFVWGPMPLLKESRLNHLGKVAFRHLYWNAVLPGYDLPGVEGRLQPEGEAGHREPTRG